MTQDFAKIRPEPILERKPVETPPAWSLMFTGMIVGLTIGVFACFLFYLSGNVPPLIPNSSLQNSMADMSNEPIVDSQPDAATEDESSFEFYTELQNYEVLVDATPVEITTEDPDQPLETSYMLQTGAFEQLERANHEMQRQQALGLDVTVKQQALPGHLYFLQSGPYLTLGQLNSAEQMLRSNNIPSMRLRPQ